MLSLGQENKTKKRHRYVVKVSDLAFGRVDDGFPHDVEAGVEDHRHPCYLEERRYQPDVSTDVYWRKERNKEAGAGQNTHENNK